MSTKKKNGTPSGQLGSLDLAKAGMGTVHYGVIPATIVTILSQSGALGQIASWPVLNTLPTDTIMALAYAVIGFGYNTLKKLAQNTEKP